LTQKTFVRRPAEEKVVQRRGGDAALAMVLDGADRRTAAGDLRHDRQTPAGLGASQQR